MTRRPELTSGLIAVKGQAVPASEGPTRSPSLPPPSLAVPAAAARNGKLAPLNFRVDGEFRRMFKTYAARHDLKLNELLKRSFDAYRARQGD